MRLRRSCKPPKSQKELQRFLGQVNFLRRFISNSAGKLTVFSPLLKLKDSEEFKWEEVHKEAFEAVKKCLAEPPVLIPPVEGKPLQLYISATDQSIGALLAQNNDRGHERGSKPQPSFTCDRAEVFPY